MTKTTLTNNFHNTEYTTRLPKSRLDYIRMTSHHGLDSADKSFARRARKALCGSDTCTCSGTMGERPAVYVD